MWRLAVLLSAAALLVAACGGGSDDAEPTPAATALSDLLDTGHDDLLAELRGGADLLEMLQDRGISRSQALATVGEGSLVDTTA